MSRRDYVRLAIIAVVMGAAIAVAHSPWGNAAARPDGRRCEIGYRWHVHKISASMHVTLLTCGNWWRPVVECEYIPPPPALPYTDWYNGRKYNRPHRSFARCALGPIVDLIARVDDGWQYRRIGHKRWLFRHYGQGIIGPRIGEWQK